jgi:hypothetical protein
MQPLIFPMLHPIFPMLPLISPLAT